MALKALRLVLVLLSTFWNIILSHFIQHLMTVMKFQTKCLH
eukprot:UN02228